MALAFYLTLPIVIYPVGSRPDVAAPFFVLIGLWLLSEGGTRPNRTLLFLAAGFTYALAVLSHFIALLAGPVLALMLWQTVGLCFWRRRAFWTYVIGWGAPILTYCYFVYVHSAGTLQSLMLYPAVAGDGRSMWDVWPLRAALTHWAGLHYFGALHFWLTAAGVVVPLLIMVTPLRYRLSPAARLWLPVPALLAAMVSIYPNIASYGYYAPLYLVPLGVVGGLSAATVFGRYRLTFAVAGLCVLTLSAASLFNTAQSRVEATGLIPVTAALDFFDSLGFDPDRPVVAYSQWVFARTGRNLQSITGLRHESGRFDFPKALRRVAPRYRPFAETQAIVLDDAADYAVLFHSILYRQISAIADGSGPELGLTIPPVMRRRALILVPELASTDDRAIARYLLGRLVETHSLGSLPGFSGNAVFLHPRSVSGSHTVFSRDGSKPWPTLGIATADGPVRLSILAACHQVVPVNSSLDENASGMRVRRFALNVPAPFADPLLLRVVVSERMGFASTFSNLDQADRALAALPQRAPFVRVATATTSFRLPTGEWGRDLLLPTPSLRDGVVIVASTAEARVDRFELALPKRATQTCTDADRTLLAGLAKGLAGPEPRPLLRAPIPDKVAVGAPFDVVMTEPITGLIQIWQGGRPARSYPFSAASTVSVVVPERGQAGIEIYIDTEGQPRRLGLLKFVTAE